MLPQKRSMHARWRASKRSMAATMAKRLAVRTHSTASCATPCIAAGTSGRWMFAIPVTRPATRAGWWVMQALQSSELPVAERLALLDVAHNAWAAAFCDTRVLPWRESECGALDVHISVLSELGGVEVDSEEHL